MCIRDRDVTLVLAPPAGVIYQPPTMAQPASKRRKQERQQEGNCKDCNEDGGKVADHAYNYTTREFSML